MVQPASCWPRLHAHLYTQSIESRELGEGTERIKRGELIFIFVYVSCSPSIAISSISYMGVAIRERVTQPTNWIWSPASRAGATSGPGLGRLWALVASGRDSCKPIGSQLAAGLLLAKWTAPAHVKTQKLGGRSGGQPARLTFGLATRHPARIAHIDSSAHDKTDDGHERLSASQLPGQCASFRFSACTMTSLSWRRAR